MSTDLNSILGANPPAEAGKKTVVRRESQRVQAPRERPKNFGGPRLKLGVVGEIPGFHLYWGNDDAGEIEQLLYEGFEFVEPKEVSMQSHIVADADVANRISRYVGKKDDGSPLRAYLLKCPDEVWAQRESYRHEMADDRDRAIRQGTVAHDSGRYMPKGVNISLNTGFQK